MNLGKRLYDLQQLDLTLDKATEGLSRVENELNHNEALEAARAALQAVQDEQAALHKRQREAEQAVDDLEAKLKPVQQKLVKVSGSNPKELVAMEKQAVLLKGQVSQEEDRILEMMGEAEALQATAAARAAEVQRIERDWAERRRQLQAEQAELAAAMESTRRTKDEVLGDIDPAHRQLYENLRQRKQGLAVARIEQGRCQGCKIAIPVSELTKARAGDLVQCGSCSRVLCVP